MKDLSAFPHLFSPVQVGALTLRNRIVSTGHDTTMPTDGRVNDALIAYHEARAAGGVGLIVVQVTGVHESARYTNHVLMGCDDSCIEDFARLAERIHAHGTKVFVQLFHPGREMTESLDGSAPIAWSSSASVSERFHVIPKAMDLNMIAEVIAGYGETAARLERAGVDGVEIVASHGYLPSQFLNPNVNRREDRYGGNVENRRRFIADVISSVRAATSANFALGLRISADEQYEQGLTQDLTLETVVSFAEQLDYVSVVAGSSASLGASIHIAPPMYYSSGYTAPLAKAIKQQIDIPVTVTGRINQPQDAELLLASGQADQCGMTRAMICDPGMPNKAQREQLDDIRACIGCNQACIGHFHKGHSISCIQFPESGRELLYAKQNPAAVAKKVLVVGGGPAGMKVAAVAAQRGHQVTLCEASGQLGGQVLLAQSLPERSEFAGIITNLSHEMHSAGVKLHLGCRVDADFVLANGADHVIVATGAKARWPENFHCDEESDVVDASQVLRAEVQVGSRVLIADWRCDWVGMGLAELLAKRGSHVRLAVNGLSAGEMLQSYVRDSGAARLHRLGVKVIPYARLFGRDHDSVYLQHTVSGEAMIQADVDTLVLAQGAIPELELLTQLNAAGIAFTAIGDCQMARTCEEAVLEGLQVGWEL